MTIGFLTSEYPHQKTGSSGGIGTSIYNLARGLVKEGHTVKVFVYQQPEDAYFIDEGIHIYAVKNIIVKGISLFLTQNKVSKLINTHKDLDIIEVPDWTGFSSFLNVRVPVVMRLNGSDTYFCYLEQRKLKKKNYYLERIAYKRAKGIIAVSKFTGELTNTLFKTNRLFEVIPNSIDVNQFDIYLNQPNNEPYILYFGTLIRKKGVLELPLIFNEIHKQYPNIRFLLVGNDSGDIISGNSSTWELMQPLFSKEALQQVTYTRGVAYSEIKSYIAKASVCVFPSFAEALPLSWLEAMAMEKPIVASTIGWANEMITHGEQGFLVHPTHHQEFASYIIELLKDTELSVKLGKAARQKVIKEFSTTVVAQKSVAYYEKIIKSAANV
ncbi:glycosyltransferase family 4 protein [Zhouia sp. PK063]|uniref:glycosyltransferase family 4 protein n=1 Tax=Zhouia sp. PK063 TaxID=3373602 RepID=UPI0037B38401